MFGQLIFPIFLILQCYKNKTVTVNIALIGTCVKTPLWRSFEFWNFSIIRTKSCFPPASVEHCNFAPDFSSQTSLDSLEGFKSRDSSVEYCELKLQFDLCVQPIISNGLIVPAGFLTMPCFFYSCFYMIHGSACSCSLNTDKST